MSDLALGPGHVEPSNMPAGWVASRLERIATFRQGGTLGLTKSGNYVSSGAVAFSAAGPDGFVDKVEFNDQAGVVLSSIGANCGRCFYAEGEWTTLANVQAILPGDQIDPKFLFYRLNQENYWERSGSAQPFIKPSSIKKAWIAFPRERLAQTKISHVIGLLDTEIEVTEALIAKQERLRDGLMQDLFTRGVDGNGELRPRREEAPHLYQETELGWLPKGWSAKAVCACVDKISDGPFGSNLKSEHYVTEPGVRVIRLQNIQAGYFDASDEAFVSEEHGRSLARFEVRPEEVLIASLGDDRFEAGRACLYPSELGPAINKADCFRARAALNVTSPFFLMCALNSEQARRGKIRLVQGVTRQRINTTNYKALIVPIPDFETGEQSRIVQLLQKANVTQNKTLSGLKELRRLKSGLMQDLLTGRVSVEPLLEKMAA